MAKQKKTKVVRTRIGLKRAIIKQLKTSRISPKRVPEKVKEIMTALEPQIEWGRHGICSDIQLDFAPGQIISFRPLPPKKTKARH